MDSTFSHPLLDEDDDDYTPVAPKVALTLPRKPEVAAERAQAVSTEPPKFGQKGFRKGVPNNRRATPRSRVTETDAKILEHLARWPACTIETISVLHTTEPSRVSKGGTLMSVGGAQLRIDKLIKMGLVEKDWALDGSVVYGATEGGVFAARHKGYVLDDHSVTKEGFRNMSYEQMDHYRYIGQVAAMLKSEANFYKKDLNIEAVRIDKLITEPQMRRDQKPIADRLFEVARKISKDAKNGDHLFAAYRETKRLKALELVRAGKLDRSQIIEWAEFFRCLGQTPVEDEFSEDDALPVKGTHFPDLTIDLEEGRTSAASSSVAVEIELSRKPGYELTAILNTYAKEFEHKTFYGKVIYFTTLPKLEAKLRNIDKWNGFGLFANGLIEVVLIADRFGNVAQNKKKVGDGKAPARRPGTDRFVRGAQEAN